MKRDATCDDSDRWEPVDTLTNNVDDIVGTAYPNGSIFQVSEMDWLYFDYSKFQRVQPVSNNKKVLTLAWLYASAINMTIQAKVD